MYRLRTTNFFFEKLQQKSLLIAYQALQWKQLNSDFLLQSKRAESLHIASHRLSSSGKQPLSPLGKHTANTKGVAAAQKFLGSLTAVCTHKMSRDSWLLPSNFQVTPFSSDTRLYLQQTAPQSALCSFSIQAHLRPHAQQADGSVYLEVRKPSRLHLPSAGKDPENLCLRVYIWTPSSLGLARAI